MKKTLFMLLAASALASCSQDEVLEATQKEAISFNDAFVENATRAIDNTYHSTKNMFTSFNVYGTTKGDENGSTEVTIFNKVPVSNTNNAWNYDSQYTQYWIDGNTYNFAAVVNGEITTDKKINYTADGTTDLLYAKNNYGKYTKSTSETTVPFTFTHLLAKVQFTVKNEISTNVKGNVYTYKVTNIQIDNAYPTGTYDITKYGSTSENGWTASGTQAALTFGNVSNANATSNSQEAVAIGTWIEGTETKGIAQATSHNARLLVPATYTKSDSDTDNSTGLIVSCTITTYLNDEPVDVENYKKSITYTFEEGKAYNFIITKGNPGEEIKFSATMTDWSDPQDATNLF